MHCFHANYLDDWYIHLTSLNMPAFTTFTLPHWICQLYNVHLTALNMPTLQRSFYCTKYANFTTFILLHWIYQLYICIQMWKTHNHKTRWPKHTIKSLFFKYSNGNCLHLKSYLPCHTIDLQHFGQNYGGYICHTFSVQNRTHVISISSFPQRYRHFRLQMTP